MHAYLVQCAKSHRTGFHSRFSMDVIVRSNNNPVNDMTAIISGLINDLDKAIKTKTSQSMFG